VYDTSRVILNGVTGLAENPDGTVSGHFDWHWELMEMGKKLGGPTGEAPQNELFVIDALRHGDVLFRKYDDGWHVETLQRDKR
jgi:hypothetical protein